MGTPLLFGEFICSGGGRTEEERLRGQPPPVPPGTEEKVEETNRYSHLPLARVKFCQAGALQSCRLLVKRKSACGKSGRAHNRTERDVARCS